MNGWHMVAASGTCVFVSATDQLLPIAALKPLVAGVALISYLGSLYTHAHMRAQPKNGATSATPATAAWPHPHAEKGNNRVFTAVIAVFRHTLRTRSAPLTAPGGAR
jgi:hypothetical protein